MNLQTLVKQQFEKYNDLRVLFFFDADGSNEEQLETWDATDCVAIKVNQQFFTLKYQLEYELKDKKVFLYFNKPAPTDNELEEFPLADLLIANKQLHVDPVMSFIEEYHLPLSSLSAIEKYYAGELRHKNRKDYLADVLRTTSFTDGALRKGLLCYHLGLKRISDFNIIAAQLFILARNPIEFEATMDTIKSLDLTDLLVKNLTEIFGDNFSNISITTLTDLTCRFKYNLMLRTVNRALPEDQYSKLKEESPVRLSRMNSLLHDWEGDAQVKQTLQKVFDELGSEVKEEKIIEWYSAEIPYGYYTAKLKKQILENSLLQYDTHPAKVKTIIKPWFNNPDEQGDIIHVIEFLWYGSSMHEVLSLYRTFVFDRPVDFINRYTQELYSVDTNYRKANDAYAAAQKSSPINLDKYIKEFHKRYEEDFVNPFNYQWMQILKAGNFKLNEIPVAQQYNFYKEKVIVKQQKTAVIISDAFRYEVGRELQEQLSRDSKNVAKMDAMLVSIPSVTALGMANLLPNKEIKISNTSFSIDGINTEGAVNRTKILQAANPKSEAIDFNTIIEYEQDTGREYFKQNEIVYIYHNKIDAKGEKPKTEKSVFNAVQETLDDINLMIRKLNNWNVYRILITADHGFMLSLRDIPETMKEDMPIVKDEFLLHNRVVVGASVNDSGYNFNLADCSNVKEAMQVALPKSVNRYRRQGSGMQYVHGGASMQELLIPVIEYARMRDDISEKVKLRLIKCDEKITSGYLRLTVLQLEPVGTGIKALEVIVGLYDDKDELLSKEEKRIFNSNSQVPTERVAEMVLTLSAKGSQVSSCMLKCFDVDDTQRLNPIINQRILIQTTIQRDDF